MSVYVPVGDVGDWVDPSEWRPATAQELVAALQEEGVGEVVTLEQDEDFDYPVARIPASIDTPGRYLVVRIEGEET